MYDQRMNGSLTCATDHAITFRAPCRCGPTSSRPRYCSSSSTTITTCVGELTSASSACRSESVGSDHDRERRSVDLVDRVRAPSIAAAATQPSGRPSSSTATQSTLLARP